MESAQSVHGRITYRRVEAVIDAKIEDLNYAKHHYNYSDQMIGCLQFTIETLQSVREDLKYRDATHYWPSPL